MNILRLYRSKKGMDLFESGAVLWDFKYIAIYAKWVLRL